MPLISFVMPNRNKALYISDSIRTLLNQTLQDIEIVIIDDDSTDDSRDIIDTFAHRDKRIVTKYLPPTQGMRACERIDRNRNIGNQMAKSDIICVCDADDWYFPERARITYETFKKDRECGLFYGSYLQRDKFGRQFQEGEPYSFMPAGNFTKATLLRTGFFCIGHFTVGYKRETILKYPYNTYAGVGDWAMLWTMLMIAKVKPCYTKQVICAYRIFSYSLHHFGNKKFNEYLLQKKKRKMKRLLELYEGKDPESVFRSAREELRSLSFKNDKEYRRPELEGY